VHYGIRMLSKIGPLSELRGRFVCHILINRLGVLAQKFANFSQKIYGILGKLYYQEIEGG